MPFTATELQEWVKTLGIPADKQAAVLESFGAPEVLTKVGETVMLRSDYSRKQDELKAEETRLKADYAKKVTDEEKKSTDYMAEVGRWKTDKEKLLSDATKAREQVEARLTAVQAKIKELAPTYAIPETELASVMLPIEIKNDDKKDDQQRDMTGKFVAKEDYEKALREMPRITAIITVLEREHVKLFGPNAEMPDWLAMVEAGKPLRGQWEEKYKVKERRDAIAKETHDREIADARKAGADAERSKLLAENPGLGANVRRDSQGHSPVLDLSRQHASGEKKDESPRPDRGVAAAVAAFREKKYAA